MEQPKLGPAERIREMSAINADVPEMLASAGRAINAITNKPLHGAPSEDDMVVDGDEPTVSPAERKEAFTKNTTAYFTHLQSIMARLRRQAYALEEAGIITVEAPTLSTTGAPTEATQRQAGAGLMRRAGVPTTEEVEKITNGGLGNVDVGLLNSRSNSVGTQKEAELMAEAKVLLQEIVSNAKDGEQHG